MLGDLIYKLRWHMTKFLVLIVQSVAERLLKSQNFSVHCCGATVIAHAMQLDMVGVLQALEERPLTGLPHDTYPQFKVQGDHAVIHCLQGAAELLLATGVHSMRDIKAICGVLKSFYWQFRRVLAKGMIM